MKTAIAIAGLALAAFFCGCARMEAAPPVPVEPVYIEPVDEQVLLASRLLMPGARCFLRHELSLE